MILEYRIVKEDSPLYSEGEKIERIKIVFQAEDHKNEFLKGIEKEYGIPPEITKDVLDSLKKLTIQDFCISIPGLGTIVPLVQKVKMPGRKKGTYRIVKGRSVGLFKN